jgi:hypothetical protein
MAVFAVHIVDGKQQAQCGALQAADGGRFGPDLHAGGRADRAGRHRRRGALYLHEAQSARRLGTFFAVQKAQVRDVDAVFQTGGQKVPALSDLVFFLVYNDIDYFLPFAIFFMQR